MGGEISNYLMVNNKRDKLSKVKCDSLFLLVILSLNIDKRFVSKLINKNCAKLEKSFGKSDLMI